MAFGREQPHIFMVDWPGVWASVDEVKVAHQAFEEACRRATTQSSRVESLYSMFVPEDCRWVCLFRAADAAVARMTVEIAQIPERYVRSGIDVATTMQITAAS